METATVKMFTVEHEWQGRVWSTVVEGYDRESAEEHFISENPHVRVIRACDENEVSNAPAQGCEADPAASGCAGERKET